MASYLFYNVLEANKLSVLLEQLINDTQYIYCFQEEYAVVAIPIKRMQQTIADLANNGLLAVVTDDRKNYANDIINGRGRNISIFSSLNISQ